MSSTSMATTLRSEWKLEPRADVRFGSKGDIGQPGTMFALPPKADMDQSALNVRFVPKGNRNVAETANSRVGGQPAQSGVGGLLLVCDHLVDAAARPHCTGIYIKVAKRMIWVLVERDLLSLDHDLIFNENVRVGLA